MSAPYVVDVYAQSWTRFQYLHLFLNNGKMVAFSVDILEGTSLKQIIDWVEIQALNGFVGVQLFYGPYDDLYLETWSIIPEPGYTEGEVHLWTHPSKRN